MIPLVLLINDFLVIKKSENVVINNAIGRFFKDHNVLKCKSPEDSWGVDGKYVLLTYACLYKYPALSIMVSFCSAVRCIDCGSFFENTC